MYREVEKFEGKTEITYYFDSMNDFIHYLEENENTESKYPKHKWASKKTNGSNGFNDSKSWEHFILNMKRGKKEYNVDTNVFVTDKYDPKFEKNKDFYGTVAVPKHLIGLPKPCSRIKKTKPVKYYPIYIGFSESAGVHTGDIKEYKLMIFEKINALISEGHTVDINIFVRSKIPDYDGYFNLIICIKKHNQNPDMNKLMYFVCSADILRRGYFRLLEADPDALEKNHGGGYGRPENSNVDYINEKFNAILLHSLTSHGGDLGDAISSVESKLVNGGI